MDIRICHAYRTIPAEGVGIIAGKALIEKQIIERLEAYSGTSKQIYNENLLRSKINGTMTTSDAGLGANTQFPKLTEKEEGAVDYYLTQALSGHAYFGKYPTIGRKETPTNTSTGEQRLTIRNIHC